MNALAYHLRLGLALLAFAANGFAAAPMWVTNTNDNTAGGSLRAAITRANNAGGGAIAFTNVTGTITLHSPLPALAANITIAGPGKDLLTVSGSNGFRVFAMNSGTTNTLSGLTIADGMAQGDGYISAPPYYSLTCASGISNAGSLKLLNCVVRNCTNWFSYGVGIYNEGDMEMEASVVADCGTYENTEQFTQGGGIYNSGALRMTNCTVSSCVAEWNAPGGGGIYNSGNLTMSASVVESCWTVGQSDGGGICNVWAAVLCGCTVSNCDAFYGGGIVNYGTYLAITNSTIIDNSAYGFGGGLFVEGTNWLVGCTIARNVGIGGGVVNVGDLSLLDCTVSGNGDYGAIENGDGSYYTTNATVYANHCTVAFNTNSDRAGQGKGVLNSGVFFAQDCLFADNGTNGDFSGVLISQGHNLIQNTNGCTIVGDQTGNIYGADPLLGPLQDNGGPTWTDALLPGGPAIDAAACDGLTVDQRGIPRPQGLACDIGAFEFQYCIPALARIAVESRTNCSVKLCGLRGGLYTLQASTNLLNWVNIGTLIGGTDGLCDFTETGGGKYSRRFYRVLLRGGPGSVYIPAPSGIVDAPFLITATNIYQPVETGNTNGGRAEYPFNVPTAGCYVVQATVNAPNTGANSFFVNVDAEPQDPTMIWDIPLTIGFEQRVVSWRGDGTDTADQFVPIVFYLSAGCHQLIIRGREAYTYLQDITILPYPAVYLPATSGQVTAPFIITNDYVYQPLETGLSGSGRAAYSFVVSNSGNYVVQAKVNGPNDGANSFFVNVDTEPQDPYMIWDIPITSGFEQRLVSWRGNGTFDNAEFVPKVFNLTQGPHQFIIRGREANTLLQSMLIIQHP